MHQVDRGSLVAQLFESRGYLQAQRGLIIIAQPEIKKITQDIECVGLASVLVEKFKKSPRYMRALALQV